jgi:hypothetical protein
MIVPARFPAVVRHVPVGGRHERVGVVSLEGSVSIREAARKDFAMLPVSVAELGLFTAGGEVWTQIRRPGLGKQQAYGAEEFLRWLAKDDVRDGDNLAWKFVRTPLAAAAVRLSPKGFATYKAERGSQGPLRAKEIVWDGREGSAARLQAWLDANLAIVGGTVLRRLRPLASVLNHGGKNVVTLSLGDHSFNTGLPVELARIDEAAAWDPQPEGVYRNPDVVNVIAAAGPPPPRGDDALFLASVLPGHVAETIERLGLTGRAVDGTTRDLGLALRPHADAGMTGWVEPGDVAGVLAMVDEVSGRLAKASVPRDAEYWENVRDHMRAGLVTGYGTRIPEDEDLVATLAPR